MAFEVKFDIEDIAKMTVAYEGASDQIRFVMMRLLNDAVFKARQVLINNTWPQSVKVRSGSFLNAALHVNRATKQNLKAELVDSIGRGNLYLHARGGISRAQKAKRLAIPVAQQIQRGAHGVPQRLTPAAIIANTPARALRVTPHGIYVAKQGKLQLMYVFKESFTTKLDVPFYKDFDYVVPESIRTGFADAMRSAMKTRR